MNVKEKALTAEEIGVLEQVSGVEPFGRLTTRWGELKALSD